jgi:hypothetical protein
VQPFLALAAEGGGEAGKEVHQLPRGELEAGQHHAAVERARHQASVFLHQIDDLLELVPGERLVGALAAEHDLEVLRGALGELVERDDERVADRPVHVPDDLRQQVEILRGREDLVVPDPEKLRRLRRREVSSVGAPNPMQYVLMSELCFVIAATVSDESTPALR